MLKRWGLSLVLVGLALLNSSHAQTLDLQQVLARSKQAAGGSGWDKVYNIHLKGKAKVSGFDADREEWVDVLKVRYAQHFQLALFSGGLGFDGTTAWGQQPNKPATTATSGDFYAAQVSQASRKSLAYWYPQRWATKLVYLGEKTEQGKTYHVVTATPQDGRAYELWFDQETYLLSRVGLGGGVFAELSDYRTVDGLKVPFFVKADQQESKLNSVEFNVPILNDRYQAPVAAAPRRR